MAKATKQYELYYAKDRKTWRKWLEKNHQISEGIWLVYYKIGSGKTRVEYADAVEEALCFGWIDTTLGAIDELSYKQLFTPRKPKSTWSKLNKERVEKLLEQNLMTAAGMEKIEAAKADGTWCKIDHIEAFEVPPILEKAFNTNKKAKKYFDSLGKTNKKYILYYLNGVKSEELKAKRLAEILPALNEQRMPDRYIRPSKKSASKG